MHGSRFDAVSRSFILGSPRRRFARGLATTLLGLARVRFPDEASAGKLKRNTFGCVNVGDPCRGRDEACCSGRCRGKRPNKGERDKSRCVAHDRGGCQAGQRDPDCGGAASILCESSAGEEGVCQTTTGKAGYCAFSQSCFPCKKDVDCERFCGAGAACLRCRPDCAESSGGTACAGVGPEECEFPPPPM